MSHAMLRVLAEGIVHFENELRVAVGLKNMERAVESARKYEGLKAAYEIAKKVKAPRRTVQWFGDLMEQKLRENDGKGGWSNESLGWLLGRLRQETKELAKAIASYERDPRRAGRAAKVAREAADIANFAMMIADVAGELRERAE